MRDGVGRRELGDQRFARGRVMNYPFFSVDDAVHRIAVASPHATAVRQRHVALSYEDLDLRAHDIRERLVRLGVQPGDVVAVCVPRSLDLVCVLLGVLQAGAAYCVLDPEWPVARRTEVASDTNAVLVVTEDSLRGIEDFHLSVNRSTDDTPSFADAPIADRLDSGFCVYHTSGTSGRPKAVMTTHRAVFRTLLSPTHPRPRSGITMLSAAALPWDAFTLEVWFPLLHGGTVELMSTTHLGPEELRLAVRSGVNTAWITSSVFNLIVDDDLDAFEGLDEVLTGGERLSPTHARTFLRRYPQVALINGYGPVETSVFATTHAITQEDTFNPSGIPVGRPLPATDIYLLRVADDGSYAIAEDGAHGVIAISGDGLGLGYIGRAAATNEESFPTIDVGGVSRKVYITGDIGSWSNGGELMFAGRRDRQVKVRGNRVDPGEVEARILEYAAVSRCAVKAVERGTSHALVAYVVLAKPSAQLETSGLESYLATTLPKHLVPSRLIAVSNLPVGASGKVDYAALHDPFTAELRSREAHSHPNDEGAAEDEPASLVARLAAELLGLQHLARDQDLIACGLDSLLAIRLSHQAAKRYALSLNVQDILRLRTAAEIASTAERVLPKHQRATDAFDTPSPAQLALWLDDQVRPERRAANLVAFAYRLDALHDSDALEGAIRAVVHRHRALRTAIQEDADGDPVLAPLPVAAALSLSRRACFREPLRVEVQGVAEQLGRLISLQGGPLLAAEINEDPGGITLVLAAHHAVLDGYSETLLVDEMSAIIADMPLPSVVSSLPSEEFVADPARDSDYAPWVERLSRTHMIEWRPPLKPSGRYQSIPVHLEPDTVAALRQVARNHNVTPFVVILTAFGEALRMTSETPAFCVGVPELGRDTAEAARVVGALVRTLVVPFDEESWARGVPGTKEAWDRALLHRNVALHDLARDARRGRQSGNRLFGAQLVWQNYDPPVWRIDGVQASAIDVEPFQGQFDVTLELGPVGAIVRGRMEFDGTVLDRRAAVALVRAFGQSIEREAVRTTEDAR